MDPDMILMRPISHDFSNDSNQLWVDGDKPDVTHVSHGHPIAQQDGYLNNAWMKLDYFYITQDPTVKPPAWKDGPKHWNTGPPYLATVQDMFRIVTLWCETAPRTFDVYPELFAEMYGFIWATVMLNMPFALTKSIVISTTKANDREGWKFIDSLDDNLVCRVSAKATSYGHNLNASSSDELKLPILPLGLHYCGRYAIGKWFFSKYRVKKNIMNCEKNLLKEPPLDHFDFRNTNYIIIPPRADLKDGDLYKEKRESLSSKQAKREVFMLCGLITGVNKALFYLKQQACTIDYMNLNMTYTVHDDPTNY